MSNLTEWGRFSEPALYILMSLAAGPKHGYAMIDDIESFAGMRLGPGTLYGAIGRLEENGLIEALPSDDRRRPYQLTPAGREFLGEQLTTMQRIIQIGTARLGNLLQAGGGN